MSTVEPTVSGSLSRSALEAGGSATAQLSPAGQAAAPTVDDRLDDIRGLSETFPSYDASRDIAEVMTDTTIPEAERDRFLAGVVDLAGGNGISADGAERIRASLGSLGESGSAADIAATQESLGRQIANGTVDAAALSALFADGSRGTADGLRVLMAGIADGRVLNRVADTLLTEARAIGATATGADRERYAATLMAAAGVANLAAAHGARASSRAVLEELTIAMAVVPRSGDLGLIERLLVADGMGISQPGDRSALNTLATLINSATGPGAGRPTIDRADALFADIIRTASSFGLGESGLLSALRPDTRGVASALDQLGRYFEANTGRLLERDWTLSNSGSPHEGLVQDFLRHVMLNPDYVQRDRSAQALGTTIDALNTTMLDGTLALHARTDAARALGILFGSLKQAGEDFVADSRLSAQQQAGLLGGTVDLLFRTAIRAGGLTSAAQPAAEAAARGIIGALTDGHVQAAGAAAQGRADAALGATSDTIADYRRALADLPPAVRGAILDAFDFRAGTRDRP
jgi:uncharacterized protein YidB (DUF937 family)